MHGYARISLNFGTKLAPVLVVVRRAPLSHVARLSDPVPSLSAPAARTLATLRAPALHDPAGARTGRVQQTRLQHLRDVGSMLGRRGRLLQARAGRPGHEACRAGRARRGLQGSALRHVADAYATCGAASPSHLLHRHRSRPALLRAWQGTVRSRSPAEELAAVPRRGHRDDDSAHGGDTVSAVRGVGNTGERAAPVPAPWVSHSLVGHRPT